jgi:hypothetical protein
MFPDVRVHTPYPIQFGGDKWITVVTNVTGTFTGKLTQPDGAVVPPTGKPFELEFGQTSKWDGDQLIAISACWTPRCRPSRSGSPKGGPARLGVPKVESSSGSRFGWPCAGVWLSCSVWRLGFVVPRRVQLAPPEVGPRRSDGVEQLALI